MLACDEYYGRWFPCFRIARLPRLDQAKTAFIEQPRPALESAEIPRRRIGELLAESCPGPRPPPVFVGKVAAAGDRMKRLDDERSAGREQCRNAAHQSFDRLFPDQREVGDCDVHPYLFLGGDELHIRRYPIRPLTRQYI